MDRKLRKMKKAELLELLLEDEREIERLKAENVKLRKMLKIQRLKISEAGSIAEAALSLSGIFEAAQRAADMYLKFTKYGLEDITAGEEEGKTVGKAGSGKESERNTGSGTKG